MAKVELVRDGASENIIARVDGKVVRSCKEYETDAWVTAIVEAQGGTYEEIEDYDAVWDHIEGRTRE